MAKRTADKQLTKDDGEEISEDEGQQGITVADKATLASRPMRKLPKRLGGGSATPVVAPKPTESAASKFPGFGSGGTGSPFTFTPPASPSTVPNGNQGPMLDASFKPTPATPPKFTPTATKTAQTIGDILASPAPIKPTPGPSKAAKDYFLKLRGLNKSFIEALQKATDEDPFIDVSGEFFQTYKKHLLVIQTEHKTSEAEAEKATAPAITFSKAFGLSAASSTPSPSQPKDSAPAATGNVPPKPSFSFPSASSTQPFSFGGDKPATTSSGGFSFPPASSPKPSPFGATSTSSGTSFFGNAKQSAAPSNAFGGPAASTTAASPFGAPPSTTASTTSLFGLPPASSAPAPSFGAPSSGSGTFIFGTPSANKESSPPKPAAATASFFSTPPPGSGPLAGFGGFGKPTTPGGSIGNPVGFGFGVGAKKAEEAPASSGGSQEEGNAAGSSSQQSTEPAASSQEIAADASTSNGGLASLSTSPHDEEGEGEEDEVTVHVVKLKAYKLKKGDGGGWADMGVGMLRLKKHKETEARRVLMRNSGSGKININFRLYGGLSTTHAKKALTFVGHDETGTPTTYSLRTKSEDAASELKEVFDREIAFVKAKE